MCYSQTTVLIITDYGARRLILSLPVPDKSVDNGVKLFDYLFRGAHE